MAATNEGAKHTKGGDFDISNGPLKKRRCTDVLFLMLFIAGIGLYGYTGYYGIDGGDAERLVAGRDWQGNFCGMSGEKTNSDVDLESFGITNYFMNVTATLDLLTKSMFTDTYVSGQASTISSSAQSTLDVSTWASDGTANTVLNSITNYFNPSCLNTCLNPSTTSSSTYTRTYTWEGPTDATMRSNWLAYLTDGGSTTYFTFKALPLSVCPYDAQYCVPITSTSSLELLSKYCVPLMTTSSGSTSVPDSWGSSLSSGFGTMLGDLKTSWKVIAITAASAVVIGLGFVFFLRYCVGVFVWGIIWGCFALMVASGVTGVLYSNKCKGESLSSTGSRLVEDKSLSSSCEYGYSVTNSDLRTGIQILSYIVLGISALYLLVTIFLCKRIKLGIALNKVAAVFVGHNLRALFLPVIQTVVSLCWMGCWIVIALYTASKIPSNNRDLTSTWTEFSSAATGCDGSDNVYVKSISFPSDSDYVTTTYACEDDRYYAGWQIYYQFFFLLWVLELFTAIGQMIISGAVGVWYFTPNTEKSSLGGKPMSQSTRNTFRYHLGTVSFGSLILGIIGFVKWMLTYMAKTTKATGGNNRVMKFVYYCIMYCVSCIERFVRFLNKNAYIQTSLLGTNFCTSAKNAFQLVLRNAARFGALAGIGGIVNLFGKFFITAGTTAVGWFLLVTWYDGDIHSPVMPVICFIIIGYVIGGFVMGVYTLAVDASLQCFLFDEELHSEFGGAKYTPSQLQEFVKDK
jgi:solute carrier family 44 (choline transporter-like protein), member 2/4/5